MQSPDITAAHQEIVGRIAALARDSFLARADHYDRTASFPAEDFADLFRAGLHAPAVPREYGGLGLGPYREDVFTLWSMTRELARVVAVDRGIAHKGLIDLERADGELLQRAQR